jgi:hypothetical protein
MIIGVMLLAGCEGAPDPADSALALAAHLDECSRSHDYDPSDGRRPDDALGAHELAWRECLYDGIAAFLAPYSPRPDIYRMLVTRDRQLTGALAAGELTRGQRKAELAELLRAIGKLEREPADASAATVSGHRLNTLREARSVLLDRM